jgi:hypothetical protein
MRPLVERLFRIAITNRIEMKYGSSSSGFRKQGEGDVKRVFEEIRRKKRLPFVPNSLKSLKKLRDSNAALNLS